MLGSVQGSESEVWYPLPFPRCCVHDLGQVTSPLPACFLRYEVGVKALLIIVIVERWGLKELEIGN